MLSVLGSCVAVKFFMVFIGIVAVNLLLWTGVSAFWCCQLWSFQFCGLLPIFVVCSAGFPVLCFFAVSDHLGVLVVSVRKRMEEIARINKTTW